MKSTTRTAVFNAVLHLAKTGLSTVSSTEVIAATQGSSATVRRHLNALCTDGQLTRTGQARATRYELSGNVAFVAGTVRPQSGFTGMPQRWSSAAIALTQKLGVPLGARTPVTYRREFVEGYTPNQDWLIPKELADSLYQSSCLPGDEPAGTYARKVFGQLLIDLSWSSARLEGNRYTLQATRKLFKDGAT